MFDEREDLVERVAKELRRPARIDPAFDQRVMQAIAALPSLQRRHGPSALWRWFTRPRAVALSPLGAVAVAAGLVALVFGLRDRQRVAVPGGEQARGLPFVVLAPHAARVSLVGDFNDWDAARTPMRRLGGASPVWTTVVPLAPGRYRYAFLADGSRWLADPAAPRAGEDEFGPPSSVVTVEGS